MTLSIVIPALNEANDITEAVRRASSVEGVREVIVSDGGSRDGTVELARQAGANIVEGAKGRGAQLDLGSRRATGDVVVFLHADTWLPVSAGPAINAALNSARTGRRPVIGGGFLKRFRDAPWAMRGARFRSWAFFRLTGVVLGDQALFVRRPVLEDAGGVPPVPLMEEFELCRRLRPFGRLVLISPSVSASARRFRKQGTVRTYLRMARVLWLYYRGRPLSRLQAIYETGRSAPEKNSRTR